MNAPVRRTPPDESANGHADAAASMASPPAGPAGCTAVPAGGRPDEAARDLDLLRRYEPVLCFTQGEMFFPCAVDGYVERAGLWARRPARGRGRAAPELVAPPGSLAPGTLADVAARYPDRQLFLRFIDRPLSGLEYQRWRWEERPPFHAPGRLARVGLGARFADALFSLSLLARGTVPGGTAAAAARRYREMQRPEPGYTYYGRVVHRAGYTVLHYLFFYVMNDWRSSFAGLNDHEADWEQVFVVLADGPDGLHTPVWVAAAAHEEAGDDLRRRWDDPALVVEGTHPVIFAAAGSHAAYFEPGEYLTLVLAEFLRPVLRAVAILDRIWRDVLRQGDPAPFVSPIEGLLRVPFIDYARGDGARIGPDPNALAAWQAVLIDDETPWVGGYSGLWGLDTEDVLGGELAPAGPKYTREGGIRRSWHDPLGWAGLGKVATPNAAEDALRERIAELERELATLDARIAELETTLPREDLEVRALGRSLSLRRLYDRRAQELERNDQERTTLVDRRAELEETIAACRAYLADMQAGLVEGPRAHLTRRRVPEPPSEARRGRLAELWAALSTGLLLLFAVGLLAVGANNRVVSLLLLVATVVVVESILHRRLDRLLLTSTIGLAVATTCVLIYHFFWQINIAAVVAIAAIILVDNIRELQGRG